MQLAQYVKNQGTHILFKSRKPVEVKREENLTSDYYGMLVFDRPKMKKYLSKDSFKGICDSKDDFSILNLCNKHVISHIRKQKLKKLNEI